MDRTRFLARRSAVALTALTAVAGLSACTESAQEPAPAAVTMTAPAPSSSIASVPAMDSATAPAPSSVTAPTAAALPVIATRKGVDLIGGESLGVSVNSVVVREELMTVTFTARSDATETWAVGSYFHTGNSTGTSKAVGAVLGDDVDGVYVLDPAAKRRYLPARDAEGNCVCSTDLAGRIVPAGSELVLEAVFAAPPESSNAVDVSIPNVGTFIKVPVTRG